MELTIYWKANGKTHRATANEVNIYWDDDNNWDGDCEAGHFSLFPKGLREKFWGKKIFK